MTRDFARFDIGHPAPGSAEVGAGILWVAFLLPPFAWSLQLAAGTAITGLACIGDAGRREAADLAWAAPAAQGVNIAALLLALGALVLSFVLLRRTRRVDPRPEGGVMKAGEGRARFMAVWGLCSAVLFAAAIVFNTFGVFWGGLCLA